MRLKKYESEELGCVKPGQGRKGEAWHVQIGYSKIGRVEAWASHFQGVRFGGSK